jgi:hypothetical protein
MQFLHNMAQVPTKKDGGTGTYTTPSADPKADAMESSVIGEKGDDVKEE